MQIVRDRVVRLNEHGPDGLVGGKAPGPRALVDDGHHAALARAVEARPIPAVHGVVRWRIIDLCRWLHDAFALSVSGQTPGRELRTLGHRRPSARPRHHA